MMFNWCGDRRPHSGHSWSFKHARYVCEGVLHDPELMLKLKEFEENSSVILGEN